jgi:hypothetical protein
MRSHASRTSACACTCPSVWLCVPTCLGCPHAYALVLMCGAVPILAHVCSHASKMSARARTCPSARCSAHAETFPTHPGRLCAMRLLQSQGGSIMRTYENNLFPTRLRHPHLHTLRIWHRCAFPRVQDVRVQCDFCSHREHTHVQDVCMHTPLFTCSESESCTHMLLFVRCAFPRI